MSQSSTLWTNQEGLRAAKLRALKRIRKDLLRFEENNMHVGERIDGLQESIRNMKYLSPHRWGAANDPLYIATDIISDLLGLVNKLSTPITRLSEMLATDTTASAPEGFLVSPAPAPAAFSTVPAAGYKSVSMRRPSQTDDPNPDPNPGRGGGGKSRRKKRRRGGKRTRRK